MTEQNKDIERELENINTRLNFICELWTRIDARLYHIQNEVKKMQPSNETLREYFERNLDRFFPDEEVQE